MKTDDSKLMLEKNSKVQQLFLMGGFVGFTASFAGFFYDKSQFYFSYLTAFSFWLSIALGALFLIMLHHLTGSIWSVALRRLYENLAIVLPWFAVMFLVIVFGNQTLFHWTHADRVATDPLLQSKSPYLNLPFFIVRGALYFLVWGILAHLFHRSSAKQDESLTDSPLHNVRRTSAPGIILYAFTISFASFDWLMSLDAHWYSTIFGVYFFSGSTLAALAFTTFIIIILHRQGYLKGIITVEHFHDLGKLLFTFTVFWAYVAFSQYFLIWYANIPEETIWFQHRWVGNWKLLSYFLVIGHFVVPFFILMIRASKRSTLLLSLMTLWLLLMHWIDLYWIIQPSLHHEGFHLSWMDAVTFIAIGSMFLWLFLKKASQRALVPIRDPQLSSSVQHRN